MTRFVINIDRSLNNDIMMTSLVGALLLALMTSCKADSRRHGDAVSRVVTSLKSAVDNCSIEILSNCNRYMETPSCSCDWKTCRLYGECCKTLAINHTVSR